MHPPCLYWCAYQNGTLVGHGSHDILLVFKVIISKTPRRLVLNEESEKSASTLRTAPFVMAVRATKYCIVIFFFLALIFLLQSYHREQMAPLPFISFASLHGERRSSCKSSASFPRFREVEEAEELFRLRSVSRSFRWLSLPRSLRSSLW